MLMQGHPKLTFCFPGGNPSPLHWSGVPYNLTRAFEKLTEVEYFALPKSYARELPRYHPSFLWRRALRKWMPLRDEAAMREMGRNIERSHPGDSAVCFCIGGTPVAFVPRSIRTAYFQDAVNDQYHRLFGINRHLSPHDLRVERRLEQRCLERADAIFYSSEWAASECRRRLPSEQHEKVSVVGMGANLPAPAAPSQNRKARPRLLWVGSEWKRKGGDLVIELFLRIQKIFNAAELTLVGAVPLDLRLPPGCQRVPFVSKSTKEGVGEFVRLYESHDFLVHPTRMDCSACVAVEAQLYGCVPVTSTVGGVPELLVHGRTGFAFPLECYQEKALAAVASLVGDMDGFNAIRQAAHAHVVKNLTWDVIARKILDRLSEPVMASKSKL